MHRQSAILFWSNTKSFEYWPFNSMSISLTRTCWISPGTSLHSFGECSLLLCSFINCLIKEWWICRAIAFSWHWTWSTSRSCRPNGWPWQRQHLPVPPSISVFSLSDMKPEKIDWRWKVPKSGSQRIVGGEPLGSETKMCNPPPLLCCRLPANKGGGWMTRTHPISQIRLSRRIFEQYKGIKLYIQKIMNRALSWRDRTFRTALIRLERLVASFIHFNAFSLLLLNMLIHYGFSSSIVFVVCADDKAQRVIHGVRIFS